MSRSRGYTMVPNAVLRGEFTMPNGRPLSHAARLLYALILDMSNGGQRLCRGSQATFARHLDLTDRQVRTLLGQLRDVGLIEVHREGRGITNTVDPLLVPDRKSASAHPRKSASGKQDLPLSNNGNSTEGNQSGWVSQQRARA